MDGIIALGKHAAPLLAAFGLCLSAAVFGFEAALAVGSPRRRVGAAILLGSAIWSAPFLSLSWSSEVTFHPLPTALSLLLTIAAAGWALTAYQRADGHLKVIGPGAILGAGGGLGHGLILIAAVGGADAAFDDGQFSAGVAIGSACWVLAFVLVLRGGRRALPWAAIAGAVGATVGGLLTSAAFDPSAPSPGAQAPLPAGAMMLLASAFVAGQLILAVLLTPDRPAVSSATRMRAWRGSRRPARSPSRAEQRPLVQRPAR